MSINTVNIGAQPNDNTGDTLRDAFAKLNARLVAQDQHLAGQDADINLRFGQLGLTQVNRGAWEPSTAYSATPQREWVIVSGQAYAATSTHTSGATFAADLAAGKWVAVDVLQLIANLSATGPGMGGELLAYRPGVTVSQALDDSLISNTRNRIERHRATLRRGLRNKRLRGESLAQLAASTLDGAKKTISGGIDLWEPDAVGGYGSIWIRDMAMCMHDFLEYFSSQQLFNAFSWYRDKCNPATFEVPDHVSLDGTVFWTPGSTNDWGSRSPTDGNTMLLQIAWLHYSKNEDLSIYNANKAFLRGLLEIGIPYDATTKCVYVDPAEPFVTWGFIDTVKLTGSVLFGSVLAYISWLQLADMAFAAGDVDDAVSAIDRADGIRNGINEHLWTETGSVGMYRASTGLCSGQLDVWGSALAVYCGIADDGRALMISANLSANYSMTVDGKPQLMHEGGIRHVLRSNDHIPGAQCWEADLVSLPQYDSYQSGAYWTTPVAWVCATLALSSPDKAAHLARILKREYERQRFLQTGSVAPAEWWDHSLNLGVVRYCTSACAALQVEAQLFDEVLPTALITLTPDAAGWNTVPVDVWKKMPFSTVVLSDFGSVVVSEMGGGATYPWIAPETGWYRIRAQLRFYAPDAAPGFPATVREVLLRVCIDNAVSGPILANAHVVTTEAIQSPFSIGGGTVIFLSAGSVFDIRVRTDVGQIHVDLTPGGEAAHEYNFLSIEAINA